MGSKVGIGKIESMKTWKKMGKYQENWRHENLENRKYGNFEKCEMGNMENVKENRNKRVSIVGETSVKTRESI